MKANYAGFRIWAANSWNSRYRDRHAHGNVLGYVEGHAGYSLDAGLPDILGQENLNHGFRVWGLGSRVTAFWTSSGVLGHDFTLSIM